MVDHPALRQWVLETAQVTQPDHVVWCDGSETENRRLIEGMLSTGELLGLNSETYPNCYLHRSHPSDVARTEHLTFICTPSKDDVGPTNNWMTPEEARTRVWPLFQGAMRGRTMYVVPYLMGPAESPYSKVGVEITDSAYVVVNMRIMTRMGQIALEHLAKHPEQGFVKGLHSLGDLSPERRFICHFPSQREIWSIGSGYGGNALLGKKCFALRIASTMGRTEGWMAEHMLILGIEDLRPGPHQGQTTYIAAAFPSACGKTNLAMLVPSLSLRDQFRVFTVGDDICWMHVGSDGRLWAINPEAGFFGVAPGTSAKTNPNALASLKQNSIFTNVALTDNKEPWWEGLSTPPAHLTDWQGRSYTPSPDNKDKAAHPNSRFTSPAKQCPCISPQIDAPMGVPISAIIFGGRRAGLQPLCVEARDWTHGVYLGATLSSETTAAAVGAVGVVRHDPMAMLPFCGYNMADYFGHWLKMAERTSSEKLPRIFHVNWFRMNKEGRYLWPGFGENIRVLKWIVERVRDTPGADSNKVVDSPIGLVPTPGQIDQTGLAVEPNAFEQLLHIDNDEWVQECARHKKFLEQFGERLPAALWKEHAILRQRLQIPSP